jgi:hypothetical protein
MFVVGQTVHVDGINPFISLQSVLSAGQRRAVRSETGSRAAVDDFADLKWVLSTWRCEHHLISQSVPIDVAVEMGDKYLERGSEQFPEYLGRSVGYMIEPVAFYENTSDGVDVFCTPGRGAGLVATLLGG